ncbi:hypothetical protein [Erythrobacter donghaensis]|uniref:hypothetical protein n=1 Tax=Erythrobacter donghaensis TaxID=267135 RepID=UPI0009396DE1|nr:hypothetical protein [Erythrobacter donghaensis]
MPQPCPPEPSRDPGNGEPCPGTAPEAPSRLAPGLALGALGAIDIAPLRAAAGCAMTTGAALALSWLLLGHLLGERGLFSGNRAQNAT